MAGRPGRPRFRIDFDTVEKLASMMCTVGEVANFLGCSRRTLEKNAEFQRRFRAGQDKGRISIRRAQFRKATNEKNPDTTMLIWLGKVYLGQKETVVQEVSGLPSVTISQEQVGLFDENYLKERITE